MRGLTRRAIPMYDVPTTGGSGSDRTLISLDCSPEGI